MSCPVCNTSPCICGDSYYKLTDEGFLAHLSVIKRIAADRKLSVKISVNDIDIDEYINNVNIVVDTSATLTTMLNNFMEVPEYYKAILAKYKGQPVLNMVTEIKQDFDIISYPLLVAIYLVLPNKENQMKLRNYLTLNFFNRIEDVDYEFEPPLVPYKIDDFFKASREGENSFSEVLYKQTNAYEMRRKEAKVTIPEFIDVLIKYRNGLSLITKILRSGNKKCIYDAMKLMCMTIPNGDELYMKFETTQKISNAMRDDLQNANYSFIEEYETMVAGDLKV